MATLEELRVELDKIDNQMVGLYQKKMNVCREVGDYKVKAGRKVYDRQQDVRKNMGTGKMMENTRMKAGGSLPRIIIRRLCLQQWNLLQMKHLPQRMEVR